MEEHREHAQNLRDANNQEFERAIEIAGSVVSNARQQMLQAESAADAVERRRELDRQEQEQSMGAAVRVTATDLPDSTTVHQHATDTSKLSIPDTASHNINSSTSSSSWSSETSQSSWQAESGRDRSPVLRMTSTSARQPSSRQPQRPSPSHQRSLLARTRSVYFHQQLP